ncbi:pirin family protein [bacterium]|nr:pirin family protein [bacterium]
MWNLRKASERGHFDHGWLDTWHSFSFGEYYDPDQMGFRVLRVINEDRVAAATGFPTHPHRDMEILTYVLSGSLEHKDSLGNGSVIRPGDIQRMTAGTGITHSEANPAQEPVHLLQIWILPREKRLTPGYEQKHLPVRETPGQWRALANATGSGGAIRLEQDIQLSGLLLPSGKKISTPAHPGRFGWIQVARGKADADGTVLHAGDGLAFDLEKAHTVTAQEDCELLFFDLP